MSSQIDVFKEVLIALRQILRAMDLQSKTLARQTGLSIAQFIALQLVESAGRMTAGELARELLLSQGTVTSIITRLEALALLRRERDTADKRQVILTLTEDGREMLAAAPRALQNVFERRFDELEGWEQMHILAALRRMSALMNATGLEASPVLDFGDLQEAASPDT